VLSKEEKRFIKYWQEQRTGGKYKYYLLYILAGTFVAVLLLSFLYSIVISPYFRVNYGFIFVLVSSFVLVTLITVLTWHRNERKFKAIIKREIEEGRNIDGDMAD
jgi:tryptophan-rich sensory protein